MGIHRTIFSHYSVIDNIKANEEIDSLAEMEKTLYLEDTPSQILTGANQRNCDSCNIDSTEHILGEITNEHISVDGKASHCGSENRTTPGFRRYVKYINKQRKHVSGILKNSSSCHVAGHEDQVIEDDGCSARSKKSNERKNLRVTFEDEL